MKLVVDWEVERPHCIVCSSKFVSPQPWCLMWFRDHPVYLPSQWEMALQCNAISHWLRTYTEWSLVIHDVFPRTTSLTNFLLRWPIRTRSKWALVCTEERSIVIVWTSYLSGFLNYFSQLSSHAARNKWALVCTEEIYIIIVWTS